MIFRHGNIVIPYVKSIPCYFMSSKQLSYRVALGLIMDNQPVEITGGWSSQRTYVTNLEFERTVTNPREWLPRVEKAFGLSEREPSRLERICNSFSPYRKGKVTFYLQALRPKIRIQITKNSYVIITSGKIESEKLTTMEFDEDILKLITPCVMICKTNRFPNAKRFTWTLTARTACVGELLQEKPLEAQRSVLKGFLNQLEEKLKKVVPEHFIFYHQHGGYSSNPYLDKIEHAKTLVALIPKVDQMDTATISATLEKVIKAIAQIDDIQRQDNMTNFEIRFGDEPEDLHD